MKNLNEENRAQCHTIIHAASIASGAIGAGLCWLPCSDAPAISAIQIGMVIKLGKVFGIKVTKSVAKAAIAAAAATAAGRAASSVATFWIPFANLAINASTAVGITEFVGWAMAEEFAEKAISVAA